CRFYAGVVVRVLLHCRHLGIFEIRRNRKQSCLWHIASLLCVRASFERSRSNAASDVACDARHFLSWPSSFPATSYSCSARDRAAHADFDCLPRVHHWLPERQGVHANQADESVPTYRRLLPRFW